MSSAQGQYRSIFHSAQCTPAEPTDGYLSTWWLVSTTLQSEYIEALAGRMLVVEIGECLLTDGIFVHLEEVEDKQQALLDFGWSVLLSCHFDDVFCDHVELLAP